MKVFFIIGLFAVAFAKPAPRRDPMINEGLFEGDTNPSVLDYYKVLLSGYLIEQDRNGVPHDSQRWPGGVIPYVISPQSAPRRDPMINEGLFEGDIKGIDPNADRNAVPHDSQRWPGGVIPYVISPQSENLRSLILEGMRHIESKSCIRFVPRTNQRDYIKIIKDNGCYSHWGRTGNEQPVSLGQGCENFAVVVHELMHAIGFEHEHNRSDRDDYLIINWANIEKQWYFAFNKLQPNQNRLLSPFDFASIMLYGSRSFAKDYYSDNYSMVRKNGQYIPEIYDRKSMSLSDAARLKTLYNC